MTSPDGRYLYNSPPNWPPPPEGWVPQEGWKPDPSWPPAPDGWQFWTEIETTEPQSRDPQRHGIVARLDPRKALEDAQARKTERAPRHSFRDTMAEAKVKADAKAANRSEGLAANQQDQEEDQHVPSRDAVSSSVGADLAAAAPPRGFLAARREKKAEAQLARELADAEAARLRERQELLAQRASLREQIDFIEGWPGNVTNTGGLVMKKGEHPVAVLDRAGLVEVKRQQGHFVAGSSGVSFRVAKGVRVRAGGARGHYVPGDEAETQIDTGSAVITNQRVVFSGSRQTREWKFDNLLGRQCVQNKQMTWMELPVSNRQKMSALSFPKSIAEAVQSAVELGLVFHSDGQADLAADLRQQLTEIAE